MSDGNDGSPPGPPPEGEPRKTPSSSGYRPSKGFQQELKDAVRPRAALMLLGVLILELGFVVSYVGAFHAPKPDRIPLAVVAPAQARAALIGKLNALPGRPLSARPADSASQARARVLDHSVDAALLVSPGRGRNRLLVASAGGPSGVQALQAVFRTVERAHGFTITDLRPPNSEDGRGLGSFYLVVGVIIGGYLASAALSASYGARPANPHRMYIRLGTLAGLSILSGLGGAIIVDSVFAALPGHFATLWAIAVLITFAAAAAGTAFQVLLGPAGIALSVLIFVVLGNPSAGGVIPSALLPPFWRAIGPAFPNGAGVTLVRNYAYFGGHHTSTAWWVLSGWAAGGVLLSAAVSYRRQSKFAPGAPKNPTADPPPTTT
ncbi:Protein of unknown function [Streptomyces sp. DvalAA-14]|uniref:DUF3533 domain-containing protein n=1 Tax=unclassified Streptomyces TaxID=2593676 RepID=UPI00081B1CE5|nr:MULTISPECIES: DUF3533 domain-containing protein [unclassified Streptomyces]MYS22803.1 DUF3533 domain-containing protein [Streptomyces sp. SID4948]SCE22630.1 Protein of unknown function [Streptomyces sp. DvalAA-14]